MMQPVQVDLFAIIPEGWGLCSACEAFLKQADLQEKTADRSLESFPPEWKAEVKQLSDLIENLSRAYGDQIRIVIHDPRSFRGMIKALRYGVRKYPAFLVAGQKRIAGLSMEQLSEALASEGAVPDI